MATDDAPNLRRLARQLVDVTRRLKHLETVPQLAHSSLDDHGMPVYDADGNLTVTVGKQPDGTWGAKPVAGPVPPRPVGLDAEGDAGTIRASWQGVFWAGAALPMDFEAVQVLVDGSVYAAIHDPEGGSVQVPAMPGERLVSFRTLSQAGVVSEDVAFGAVTVDPRVSEQMLELGENLAELRDVTLPGLADELDDAASDLQSKLDAANARIDDIIVDGGGAGNFTTYSINEPSSDGTGEGDQWFRVVNGEVIGQWRWDGAAWVPVTLTDAIIAGIDLSKLVSNGNLSEVVANKMFTDIFTANKITSQEIAAGSITTEKIAAEGIIANVIQGGSFVGETFEGGSFVGGEFRTSDNLPGSVRIADDAFNYSGRTLPGIEIIPEDTQSTVLPAGIGPWGDGAALAGGEDSSGRSAKLHATPTQAGITSTSPTGDAQMYASSSGASMRATRSSDGDSGHVSVDYTGANLTATDGESGEYGRILASPRELRMSLLDGSGNATGGVRVIAGTASVSSAAPDGREAEVAVGLRTGARVGYTSADGVTRSLSVDSRGVWVKTNKGGSSMNYNLEETAQDSGWINMPYASGYQHAGSGAPFQYRRAGNMIHMRGRITRSSGSFAQGTAYVVGTLPPEFRPSYTQRTIISGGGATTWGRIEVSAGNGQVSVAFTASDSVWADLSGTYWTAD